MGPHSIAASEIKRSRMKICRSERTHVDDWIDLGLTKSVYDGCD